MSWLLRNQIRQFQDHLYANTRQLFPHTDYINDDDGEYDDEDSMKCLDCLKLENVCCLFFCHLANMFACFI